MLGNRVVIGKKRGDEAEKPFWISFSDLMTALMVLFLVVMTVSLLAVTQQLRDVQKAELERSQDISQIMVRLEKHARDFPQVHVSRERMTIDFGEVGRFEKGQDRFSQQAADLLRAFVPRILAEAESDLGQKWFKRVIVEGFTDTDGSYLLNLDLSLRRAERVVCTLLATGATADLTAEQTAQVRRLFMVGGFSFNSTKASKEESRRVELRLDFRAADEQQNTAKAGDGGDLATIAVGKCPLTQN